MQDINSEMLNESIILGQNFSGPLLFNYVWWILYQAKQRGIHTLYFLARDGYTLREIAQRFCDRFQIAIECRYLYCSRMSLRVPSYHLIGEESDRLLTLGGCQVTYSSVLKRVCLENNERMAVYADCKLNGVNEDKLLNRSELDEYQNKLKRSKVFHMYVNKKSKIAYGDTIGYLKQEGFFNKKEVALVDSGWTGSMQRSLRQLLESAGYKGKLIGFYFGIFASPKSKDDGTYLTWYFNYKKRVWNKVLFNNNLFECLLSAPHGMTIGYTFQHEKYIPIFKETYNENQQNIKQQIQAILAYCDQRLEHVAFYDFNSSMLYEDTFRRIRRYMVHPTTKEAAYYGQFLFCDDITEDYYLSLADEEQIKLLKDYLFLTRIWKRIINKRKAPMIGVYWPYGTIAYLPKWKQPWYRLSLYIWEWLRYELF